MIRRSWPVILSFLAVLNFSTSSKAAFNGHVSIVNSVVYSADGKWALSGSWDWTMRLWDLSSHKSVRKFKDHALSVNHAVFSPDGKQLVTAGEDGVIFFFKFVGALASIKPVGFLYPTEDHAQAAANAAIRFMRYLHQRNASHPIQWSCRVGIASGPVVGSVVCVAGVHEWTVRVTGPTWSREFARATRP